MEECVNKPPEQAGFRSNMGCADHIHSLRLCAGKAREWGFSVWAASLDLEKAFDMVDRNAIWKALVSSGFAEEYVELLRKLYQNLRGRVRMEVTSRVFDVMRGTRQGDPMNPAIFNVLQFAALKELIKEWGDQGLGLPLSENKLLTNLRFIDDVLLFAQTEGDLRRMVNGFCKAMRALFGPADSKSLTPMIQARKVFVHCTKFSIFKSV